MFEALIYYKITQQILETSMVIKKNTHNCEKTPGIGLKNRLVRSFNLLQNHQKI